MNEADAQRLLEVGWEHYKQREYRRAVDEIRAAAGSLADASLALYRLGFCHRALGDHDRALDEFRRAASARPTDAWFQFQIGKELGLAGQHANAIAELAISIEKDPYLAAAYNDLGACLAIVGYFDLSVVCYTMCSIVCDLVDTAGVDLGVSLQQFQHSTDSLKRILGAAKYTEIHGSVFTRLGMKHYPVIDDHIDLPAFVSLSRELVPVLKRIGTSPPG